MVCALGGLGSWRLGPSLPTLPWLSQKTRDVSLQSITGLTGGPTACLKCLVLRAARTRWILYDKQHAKDQGKDKAIINSGGGLQNNMKVLRAVQ